MKYQWMTPRAGPACGVAESRKSSVSMASAVSGTAPRCESRSISNTNGLLRQYFPRGTDLARHSAEELEAVAAALNGRPRKTLGWRTPAEALAEYLTAAA
jgi:hypothetical protein